MPVPPKRRPVSESFPRRLFYDAEMENGGFGRGMNHSLENNAPGTQGKGNNTAGTQDGGNEAAGQSQPQQKGFQQNPKSLGSYVVFTTSTSKRDSKLSRRTVPAATTPNPRWNRWSEQKIEWSRK